MNATVRRYTEQDAETWDKLVAVSWNGTFLHQRRFLSYHGDRFQDLSLIVNDDRGRLRGVLPAALDPVREDLVISHPGLTYGGIVHNGYLRGAIMLEALQAIVQLYQAVGLRSLRYKVVPHIYHRVPSADDLYALFRMEAVRYRCDLSAAVDLTSRPRPTKGRRSDLSKARRARVQVALGPQYFEPYWTILEARLATKHGAQPAHSLQEIIYLQSMFPEQVKCLVGIFEGEVVAGVVLFHTSEVVHVQYSATSADGAAVGAQTIVMEYAIEKSREWGARYFNFGTSNEHEGWVLNEGLYQFKVSFGAGGVVHEFYEVSLDRGGEDGS
jgi:GNAT acetyltransferase-like protein